MSRIVRASANLAQNTSITFEPYSKVTALQVVAERISRIFHDVLTSRAEPPNMCVT